MKQTNLFDDHNDPSGKDGLIDEQEVIRPDIADGELLYFPKFIPAVKADDYLQILRETLQWQQDEIMIYGRKTHIPRLQAWYGDSDAQYSYSGINMIPHPWTRELQDLKSMCEHQLTTSFNSVLANWYRDGNDSMGFHADDEPELGSFPVIAALSFGEKRALNFRHKNTQDKLSLPLEHGSLLVMQGSTQRFWQHGIAKTTRQISDRLSLTFRRVFKGLKK